MTGALERLVHLHAKTLLNKPFHAKPDFVFCVSFPGFISAMGIMREKEEERSDLQLFPGHIESDLNEVSGQVQVQAADGEVLETGNRFT